MIYETEIYSGNESVLVRAEITKNENCPKLINEPDMFIDILAVEPDWIFTDKQLEPLVREDFLKYLAWKKREDELERLRD